MMSQTVTAPSTGHPPRPTLSAEDEQRVLACAARAVAAAVSRTPAPPSAEALGAVGAVPLYGVFVSLKQPGRLRSCCGALGEGIRLADALDRAAQRAATDDPRFAPIVIQELRTLRIEVWLLWGYRPLESRGDARAKDVVVGRHGLHVARGNCRGLLLPCVPQEHGFGVYDFLEQTSRKAGLPPDAWMDDDVEVGTFEGQVLGAELSMVLGEGGDCSAADARLPMHAGTFYPANATEIATALDRLFAKATSLDGAPQPRSYAAALVPHAGWAYSGGVAARVYARLAAPDAVLVLSPRHRREGQRFAIMPLHAWGSPGGMLPADFSLAAALTSNVPGLWLDEEAHAAEHAIEVQLPFLARVNPNMRVTGIVIGQAGLSDLLTLADGIAAVLRQSARPPLVLVSGDMHHFSPDAETRRLDRLLLDALATLDPAAVYHTAEEHCIRACAVPPLVVAMQTLRRLGRLRGYEEVAYATSGDATGKLHEVVGYAGVLFE